MKTKSNKALIGIGIFTSIAASLCCITPVLALVAGSSGIATGLTTRIPVIEGLKEFVYFTNNTLFDLEEMPESLKILGAGYISLEIAMAYNRFGAKDRILEFTDRPLRTQEPDISMEIEKYLKEEGIELFPNLRISNVEKREDVTHLSGKNVKSNKKFEFIEKGEIVVATGTKANTSGMGLGKIGVTLDEDGRIIVSKKQETIVENIFAVGDCTSTPAFVYTAAAEGKTAALNAIENAESQSISFETSNISLADVPRAIASNDTRGFIKLIRNPETDELLGIRVVAREGSELVMQASLAIKYGIKVDEIVNSLFPYLTLSEGIKLVGIIFIKDVKELSCCAV